MVFLKKIIFMQKIFIPCKADTYAQKSLVVGVPFSNGLRMFARYREAEFFFGLLFVLRFGFLFLTRNQKRETSNKDRSLKTEYWELATGRSPVCGSNRPPCEGRWELFCVLRNRKEPRNRNRQTIFWFFDFEIREIRG
jgi:hypothetical protein